MNEVKRILLVEDNPVDQMLFKEYLRETDLHSARLFLTDHLQKALEMMEEWHCEIVILDLSLPDCTGLEGLLAFREKHPFLPIVILTGLGESQVAMEAIQAGAQDYLMKDGLNGETLEKTIAYAMHRAQLNRQDQEETIEELRAAKKTLQFQQRELEQALEREKELNELRSHFINGASHQFRTPLAVIQSNCELLLKINTHTDERLERINERLRQEVDRMTQILDDLLRINSLTTGERSVEIEESDLVAVCFQAIQTYRHPGNEKIDITIEVSGTPKSIELSPTEMMGALHKIFSYIAVYAEHRKAPVLRIEFRQNAVMLDLVNTGIIIPDTEVDNVFQPFYQPDNKPDYTGSALSLFIARQSIESIGGQLTSGKNDTGELKFNILFRSIAGGVSNAKNTIE